MAWLNATPKPSEGTKRAAAKNQPKRLSRIDQMKADKIAPPLPPNPLPYIIERLVEIGLTEAAGTGNGPLSWQSIAAWQSVTGITLSRWEARLIRKLSIEYLAESQRAESENYPSPWHREVSEREKVVEVDRLRMVLG